MTNKISAGSTAGNITAESIGHEFERRYGAGASVYTAPGRVNLIGEHTDYNMGFVLPAAVDKGIMVAIRPAAGPLSRIYSVDYDSEITLDLHGGESGSTKSGSTKSGDVPNDQWAKYIYGVAQEMATRGRSVGAVDAVFGGNVPLGAGMSSSAALESAFGFAFNEMFGLGFTLAELAVIGQMTEHNWVGVRCGIMDQFISLHGRAGQVLKLDCRTLEFEYKPFSPAEHGYRLVLVDSMVKHNLSGGEYNERREQCEEGVRIVAAHHPEVQSLRDVSPEMLERYRGEMPELVYRRCRYVVEEIARLVDGCDDLDAGRYEEFGARMFETHRGLSQLFNVSTPELDFIVDLARSTEGVAGARLMGGGFGGCVLHLIRCSVADAYLADVQAKFGAEFGLVPRIIEVVISDGARRLV
ncbi:MAG: galactokinase [Alistipes sp.]|jgi:galactokinase|nr:galactokinase [Alistipes sp.]